METHEENHPGGLNLSHLLLRGAADEGAGNKRFVLLFHRCPSLFLVVHFSKGIT